MFTLTLFLFWTVLAEFFLREDLEGKTSGENQTCQLQIILQDFLCLPTLNFLCCISIISVGEEIEMTQMMFTKGLADSGYWGDKLFGRIMTAEVQIGEGCIHKTCRTKVIYGLDPVFESGCTCITKVRNPIAYGAKEDSNLAERNLDITKQVRVLVDLSLHYIEFILTQQKL